jgi:epoxyqueuosine reductase
VEAPSFADLEAVGLANGLHVVGATSAAPFVQTRQVLEERRRAGLNGSMQFTYRNPARSTDPDRALPGARTILVGARSYHRDEPPPPEGRGPAGRVARYVWADDQERLLAGLGAMAAALTDAGHRATVVSDQNHLVDRAAAARAGLGWYGKNANLLLPGRGSWYVLGSVLTDAVIERDEAATVADGCGTCRRCLDGCPTGAIVAPGVVDARRCLAWSVQTTGTFPMEHRVVLGDRIYGCDDCQEVCPPNRREQRHNEPVGLADPERAWIPVLELLAASDDELMARHGRWYVADREPRYLRRNALVVLGNVGDGTDPAVRAALVAALADENPLVRAHAVWSARRLGCDDLTVVVQDDPDPDVRAELHAPVPRRVPA